MAKFNDASATRSLPLTTIAKTNEPLCGAQRPKGRDRPKDRKDDQDEMVEWFKSAPMGSRHQRMLWAARKIAHLTACPDRGRERAAG
jgi:hypothetical protein